MLPALNSLASVDQTDKVLQLWKQMIANKQVHRSGDSFILHYFFWKTLAESWQLQLLLAQASKRT